ncbi:MULTISPECIES: nuclear transport factor 2 family protein [unclassified Roseateles]|uniref:nuclear transport factor 2 family protein n=1 Tax=unclassified Roseateles TaxID=2626991 RepID=UPI001910ADAB|nr:MULTISPECIES: nuclear transport factor 2 family protein [unclassified Roseateles]
MSSKPKTEAPFDYDGQMRANLVQVFGEHDAGKRLLAIQRLYAPDAVLNEPEHSAIGHLAINDAVSALLASLPPGYAFRALAPAQGHHDIGVLTWGSGPRDGAFAVTGMDVAHFRNGVIHSLFVFLMPPNGA